MPINISYLWEDIEETQEILLELKMGLNGLLLIKIMMGFGLEETAQLFMDLVGMHSAAGRVL